MPLNLGFQQQMRWGWEFARRVDAWTWAPAFKPNAPSKWLRDQSAFDVTVAKDAPVPATIPLGSLIMFGRESDHFAYSLGGDRVVHLDKSQQGNQTIGYLRDNGYRGGTFWPMFVKRPPTPAEMA